MTLLFDENFPPRLPRALRCFGIEAQHSREHLAPGTADIVVFDFLRSHGWIWVTHDKGVKRSKHERAAILGAGVGAFVLTGTVQRSPLETLAFVSRIVEEMSDLANNTARPFIFGVSDQRKFERLK